MAKKESNKDNKSKQQSKKKPTTKKRKVGRPKKRGRKKKYYKPVKKKRKSAQSSKGFGTNVSYNRVRALLWREYKHDFPSYREFISNRLDEKGIKIKGSSIVSQVYAECKSLECSDEEIITIYRQVKGQTKGEPPLPIPQDYYTPHPYYELHTENWWDGMDEKIWVYSPMLISPPSTFLGVLGEDKCVDKDGNVVDRKCDTDKGDRLIDGKKELFLPFIRWCNQFQQSGQLTTSEEVPHFKFVGKMQKQKDGSEIELPYWNEEQQRWEIQIVPCEPTGDIDDYDFNPLDIPLTVPDLEERDKYKPPPKPPTEEPDDTDKAIQLEKEKQETEKQRQTTLDKEERKIDKEIVRDITAQWKKGEITTDEWKAYIKLFS